MHPFDRWVRWLWPAGGSAVLLTVAAVGWFTQPARYRQGYAPPQPIPFSHRQHAGTLGMACEYCHSGAARSRTAGIPSLETCMGCHQVTRTESPAIQRLAAAYQRGERIAWQRVHTLPQHVAFDHRPHVAAGLRCQDCHGEVQAMTVLERRMSLRMGSCLACHREPGRHTRAQGSEPQPPEPRGAKPRSPEPRGPEHCSACHR